MDDSEINKLRNIPPFYDNVLLLGGYKLEPESCNKRLEYKDLEIEKQKFSKIKEEFQTMYSFENCKLTGVKVSWGKLNYIKIAGCNALGSSFTQVELSYGEGIADSRMEKGKIRNFGIHNMPIYRSSIIGSKLEERVYLHNISLQRGYPVRRHLSVAGNDDHRWYSPNRHHWPADGHSTNCQRGRDLLCAVRY